MHPAIGWEAVLDSLRAHAPALKARLSPDAPFGIGLRLSGEESRELLSDGRLGEFKAWLDGEGLYVFTINGFPHEACTTNVRRVDEELRGTRVSLAIEPEADGSLATVDEFIDWWPDGLENVTICFDACHSAVAYEEPEAALSALDDAGIRIGKAQLSAALRLPVIARAELQRFADPIYLHQVTQRSADGSLQSWPDLPHALDGYGGGEEWRVHFHVPIFLERYGKLESTQDHLREVIERVCDRTSRLEIETYTWDVLPPDLKASSVDSIAREYEWVLDVLR
jgi:hypothetical protein